VMMLAARRVRCHWS